MARSLRSLLGFGANKNTTLRTSRFFRNMKVRFDTLEDRITPATLWVDNTPGVGGTFTSSGGTQPPTNPATVFSTIAAAVAAAGSGDTINVSDGTYSENVTINVPLTIRGNQFGVDARTRSAPESVVNAASGKTQFTIAANNVAIDGFTIQGQTDTVISGASIYMQPGRNGSQIRNNIVQNNVVGVFVANNSGSNQTVIEKNLFRDNTNGGAAGGTDIYADQFTAGAGMQNVAVQNNRFANTFFVEDTWAFGISNSAATPFSNITFSNNSVTNHGRGAYFFNTNGATVSSNTFTGASRYAISLFAQNGTPANAAISITSNIFNVNGSGGAGVLLSDGTASDAYTGTLVLSGNQYTTSGADRSIDVESTTPVDATAETFNGTSAAAATTAQQFAIVDSILDGIDVSGFAFARTKAANVYVTPNSILSPITTSPSVQRAVDIATSGDTIHIQAGVYSGNVSTAGKAVTLTPDAGAAQVTINGSLTLDSNDTLALEINGTSPTTGFDNFIVNAIATLGNSALSISGSFVPAPGNVFTIISAASVSGTFVGKSNGSLVVLNGVNLTINYTANSVTLTNNVVVAGTITATVDGSGNLFVSDTSVGGRNNRFRVAIVSSPAPARVVVSDANEQFNGAPAGWTLAPDGKSISRPLAGFTGSIQIDGGPGTDKLAVQGDGTTSATYTPSTSTPGSGAFVVSGGPISNPLTINFLNFEPVDLSGMLSAAVQSPTNSANNLVLNAGFDSFTGTTNPAIVVSGTTGAGVAIESASLFGNTSVTIDTSSTTGAGANTITVSSALSTSFGNNNLQLKTNSNGSVTVNSAVAVSGNLVVTSPTANLNADLTAGVITGSATTVNLSTGGQLQDAVNIAASGATIFIAPGTYPGNVTMTNPITFNVPAGTATITGNLNGAAGLRKAGAGTLVVTGVNGFTGNTTVTDGRLQISNDNQLGSATGTVSVTSPGVLEITGDTATSRTYFLNSNAMLQVASGKTLTVSGAEFNGGVITGPGAITITGPTTFNGVISSSTLTINANSNATFNSFTNGGTLTLAATRTFAMSQFTNTFGGKLFVNGTANVIDFLSNGQIDVAATGLIANVGTSGLTFGGSSITNISRTGAVDDINDGKILLGPVDALLSGGTMTNNGFVVSTVPGVRLVVSFNGLAKGTGFYTEVLTINGGRQGAGASPGSVLMGNYSFNGGGIFEFEIADATGVAGELNGWDLISLQENTYNPAPKTTYSATPSDKYTIRIKSLLNSGDYNVAGAAAHFDPHQNYAWRFFLGTGPGVTVGGVFDPAAFNIDTSGFVNSISGNFSVASSDGGKSLSIVYTPALAPVATSTNLTVSTQATTGGTLVNLSAVVAPSPGNIGKVTFLDNGAPISGGVDVALVNGVAQFSTTLSTSVSHSLTAVYTGNSAYQGSTSNTQTIASSSAPAPQVVSVRTNDGVQHSRLLNLTVVFDQAVQLDTDAMALALYTNNVKYDGVAQGAGMGTVPSTLKVMSAADSKTFTITFEGAGTVEMGNDGLASLKDGVYQLTINAAKVHPLGAPGTNMAANATTVFHRLYGDIGAASQSGNDFSAIVNTGDNLQFRSAFNKPAGAGYVPYLDFNGDGIINTGDNLQFRQRFNKSLTWTV